MTTGADDTSRSRQTTRLLSNSLATYGRMLITVPLGLLATRFVLGALGTDDYGIFVVVGAAVGLVLVVDQALVASSTRHLAYALGEGDPVDTAQTFNATFLFYAGFSAAVAIAAIPLENALLSLISLPADRFGAAQFVFRMSIAATALSFLTAPWRAAIVARQALVFNAVVGILNSSLLFAAAALAGSVGEDPLRSYSVLLFLAFTATQIVVIAVAVSRFPESRLRGGWPARSVVAEISGFAGWTLVSSVGYQLRQNVAQLVLNGYFGTQVNASFGVAREVQVRQSSLTMALITPAQPAVTTMYARGEWEYSSNLALATSKIGAFIALAIGIPMAIDGDSALHLWLIEVPPFAVSFTAVLLMARAVDAAGAGYSMIMGARGKIGAYTTGSTLITLLPLAIAIPLFSAGAEAIVLPLASLAGAIVLNVFRMVYVAGRTPLTIGLFVRRVVRPLAVSGGSGAIVALVPYMLLDRGLARFAAVAIAYWAVSGPLFWKRLLPHEREPLRRLARRALPNREREATPPD